MTKEEDAIPGSINSYNDRDKMLNLSTDKEYPGVPRELSIPAVIPGHGLFAEPENRTPSGMKPATASRMKDGSRLHGDIRAWTPERPPPAFLLGQVSCR